MTHALVLPVFSGKNLRAWPKHEDGGRALYQPTAAAFRARYPTDAHTAAYSVEKVSRRLDKSAPGRVVDGAMLVVLVGFLFVDVDGADHKADPAWREGERAKVAAALTELPGGFCYQTRGGYRLVWRLVAPHPIASDDDAARWKLTYWRALLLLSRRFGIEGDPACADWTRLFRLPHTTRDPGGSPEAWPTEGDPELSATLALDQDPEALALDLTEARRLDALHPATRGDGKIKVAGRWSPAVRALAREAGEPEARDGESLPREGAAAPSGPAAEPLPRSTTGRAAQASPAPSVAPRSRRPDRNERERLWCEKALDRMSGDVARVVRGGRNNAARDAGLVLGHYAPHILNPSDIERALMAACERNGLARDGRDAALTTIRSAIGDGMAQPKRPELPADEPPRRAHHKTTDRTGPTMNNEGGTSGAEHQEHDKQRHTSDERTVGDDSPCVLVDFKTGERVREVERHLAARDDLNLYTRDGRLVCVEMATVSKRRVWRDDAGTPLAREMSLAALRCLITDCVQFERWQKEGKGEEATMVRVPCRPHDDIVRGLHGATGWPELRDLVGIARAPFLASLSGDLVTASGYHEQSGYLLTLPAGLDAIDVPVAPTREQALDALATLKSELFCDFPFESSTSRSAALAALLTLLARPALGSNNTPAVLFEANTPSSGKTLLADVCAIVGTGAMTPKHGFTTDDREMDKTLGGIASEARSIVCFDNVTDPIGGSTLDRALTCNGSLSYRLLGQNKTAQAVWRTTVFFTANNATIGGDVGRRLLVCRLESEHERPGLREGFRHDDLRAYATEHRTRFAALGLTVLRAFCQVPVAQRPKVAPLGSFEVWARLVAGALVWLGEADPINAVADERNGGVDLARVALGTLVQRWNDLSTATRAKLRWTDKGIMVKAALEALYVNGGPAEGDGLDELREAIEVLAASGAGKVPSVRQVGNALARYRGRVVDGHKLLGEQDRKGIMTWRVEKTRSVKGGSAGSAGSCRVHSKQTEDKEGRRTDDREGNDGVGSFIVPKVHRETTRQDPADPADPADHPHQCDVQGPSRGELAPLPPSGFPRPDLASTSLPPPSGFKSANPANEAGEYFEEIDLEAEGEELALRWSCQCRPLWPWGPSGLPEQPGTGRCWRRCWPGARRCWWATTAPNEASTPGRAARS